MLGQIIGGLGSIASSFIEGVQQRKNLQQQAIANKNLAEYTFNKDVEMWNAQNQYNSPQSQMARFKSAGLNPNLIYGQGSSGNASSPPRYNTPSAGDYSQRSALINPASMLSQYLDFNQKQALINNQIAQNAVLLESAREKKIRNDVQAKYAMDIALEKWNLLTSQSYATHEKGRNTEWQNRIMADTYKNLVKSLNENYQLSTQTKRTMLGVYSADAKLKQQQQSINQWKIDFMKNPKLNWANLVQAFQLFK